MSNEKFISRSENMLHFIEIIVRRRRIFLGVFSLVIFVTIVLLIFTPKQYLAVATILPPPGGGRGSDLMALTGLSSNFLGGSPSSSGDMYQLYKEILQSKRVIYKMLTRNFNIENSGKNVSLLDILDVQDSSHAIRLQMGYKIILNSMLKIEIAFQSKMTKIFIESTEPQLSADIANAFLEELEAFNRETNTKSARENRIFIEGRLEDTSILLENAEEMLRTFRETNKRIENSPHLQLGQGRLVREIRVQEEIFLTLKKEHEMSKIEEVKNLPVIRILDKSVAPISKSKPMRLRAMVFGTFLAGAIALILVFGIEYLYLIYSEDKLSARIQNIFSPLKEDLLSMRNVLSIFKKES